MTSRQFGPTVQGLYVKCSAFCGCVLLCLAFVCMKEAQLFYPLVTKNAPVLTAQTHKEKHIWTYWEQLFNKAVKNVTFKCPRVEIWGKQPTGSWHVCPQKLLHKKSPCLVYSVGINYDFSFDKEAISRTGCLVYSFDPSMNWNTGKQAPKHYFYQVGLGATDEKSRFISSKGVLGVYVHTSQKWDVRTLSSIMQMTNHSNKFIDILKIDIEGSEFAVLDNILADGLISKVKQLLIEYHIFDAAREKHKHYYEIVNRLHKAGMKIFYSKHSSMTYCNKRFFYCNQWDVGYLNSKLL